MTVSRNITQADKNQNMIIRCIILTVAAASFCCSLYQIRSRELPLKLISAFLGITFLSEVLAAYMEAKYHNNLPVFHFSNPLLFCVLSLYFTRISATVRRYNIGYILCVLAILATSLNTAFLQPIETFNSNYLLFEGLCICVLSLLALYDFENNDDEVFLNRNPHFWLSVIIFMQQVTTYFLYILIAIFNLLKMAPSTVMTVYDTLLISTLLCYVLSGLIFIIFPTKPKLA